MTEKIVWVTRVISRNFVSDFFSQLKNIIGGRLKNYEKMIDETLKEITDEFHRTYPQAKDIRVEFTEFSNQALAIIVHGVIK